MQNYVQKGQTLTVVAPYALLSGGGCQVGNIFGVTVNSQNIGDSSEFVVEGVFDLAKDASTFNPGDKVFWNNTALQATSSPLTAAGVSNKEIGYRGPEPGERRECAGRPDHAMRPFACGSIRSASARCRRRIPTRR